MAKAGGDPPENPDWERAEEDNKSAVAVDSKEREPGGSVERDSEAADSKPTQPKKPATTRAVTRKRRPAAKAESEPPTESKAKPAAKKRVTRVRPAAVLPKTRGRTIATLFALVAMVAAAWSGWSWYMTMHDGDRTYAMMRDDALRAGTQATINLNTLDYRDVESGLQTWRRSATASLYQELATGQDRLKAEVTKAKTVTTAKVLDAAITELDEHAGKARIIVGMQITVTPEEGDPGIKQTRLMGELTDTAEGWKLSALGQAPAGTATP